MGSRARRSNLRGANFSEWNSEFFKDPTWTLEKLESFRNQFSNADLRGANFKNAVIKDFDFSKCLLQGVNFEGAKFDNVNFTAVQTGLTAAWALLLRTMCFPISLLAGLICGYSFFFLYGLALNPICESNAENCNRAFEQIIGISMIVLFVVVLLIAYSKGLRVTFFVFVVVISAIAFVMTATNDEAYATPSILGLANFIGGLSGIIVQSQSSYLNSKLDDRQIKLLRTETQSNLTRNTLFVRLRHLAMFLLSLVGTYIGAFLSLREEQKPSTWILALPLALPIVLVLLGQTFAKLAIFDRSTKYTFIRSLFDSITQVLDTNFGGATLKDVVFERANLGYANFPGATIEGKTTFDGSDRNIRQEINLASGLPKNSSDSNGKNVNIGKVDTLIIGDRVTNSNSDFSNSTIRANGPFAPGGRAEMRDVHDNSINIYNEKTEKITQLITSLRETSKSFPEEEQEKVALSLDDLEKDIKNPEEGEKRIGLRLKHLMAAGATVLALSGGVATVSGSLNEISGDAIKMTENATLFTEKVKQLAGELGLNIGQDASAP